MDISTLMKDMDQESEDKLRLMETVRLLTPNLQELASTFEETHRNAIRNLVENTTAYQANWAKQLGEQIQKLTEDAIAPRLAKDFAALSGLALHEKSFALTAQNAVLESVKRIAEAQENSVAETLQNIRRSLAGLDQAPVWAALNAMRGLQVERISPSFDAFITETYESIEPDETPLPETKQAAATVQQTKTTQLTPYDQFLLMLCIAVFQTLIMIYQTIRAERPTRFDPAQLEYLKSQPEVIQVLDVLRRFSRASVTAYYEVERPVALKFKPHNASTTLIRLNPSDQVRLVRAAHKWIYVEYQDEEGLPVYGWANKKYLKKENK